MTGNALVCIFIACFDELSMEKSLESAQKHIFFCYRKLPWPNLQTFRNYLQQRLASLTWACPLRLAALRDIRLANLRDPPGLGVASIHPPPLRLLKRWSAKGLQIGNDQGPSHCRFSAHSVYVLLGDVLLPWDGKGLLSCLGNPRLLKGL